MKDDFAGKLIAGNANASPKASWWPRHGHSIARYLLLSDGSTPNLQKDVRETVAACCVEWEKSLIVPARKGLMLDHARLEMALVDSVRSKPYDKRAIERIGDELLDNAIRQAEKYATTIVKFPETTFRKLFEEHVLLFTKAVRLRKEKAPGHEIEEQDKANTLALAALTAEWF